ncbi:hypothetical protein P7K49_027983 [Saguinus oedipus]|uniref:Ig-like domain-containing protein n=1 Tax=Saguinus oedipus TaxID=9490 RepID=A0ABQ9UBY9_SAGOE|nr:hypothetical protein P7K49_027983 [Saguinus oedipus]
MEASLRAWFWLDRQTKEAPEIEWGSIQREEEEKHKRLCIFETAVPPNSHIVSEPGKNITLTCQPQMTWPVQEVRWEKIQPHQIDLLTYCNLVHGGNFTSRFPRQIVNNCSHGVQSFIVIPEARASDSGLYSCHFQASTGENETFVMRLTIAEGE